MADPLVALVVVALAWFGLDRLLKRIVGPHVRTGLWLAVGWLVLVVAAAVFADLLPLAEARDQSATLHQTPRLRPDPFSAHPLGTDTQALDMLGGVIYGARTSLQVSLVALTIGAGLGGMIGMVAGYRRGRTDALIGTVTDALLAFPPLILLLAAAAALRPGVVTIGLALGLVTLPTYVRLARANTLTFAQREFVIAARATGAGPMRILLRELLPNVIRPLMSYSFVIVAVLIVAEASLSYLGVGIQRPSPTWGNMIAAGRQEYETTPHLVFVPGTVLFLTVFALNRLGDRARELWDPRDTTL